jgi:hypothetical protein
MRDAVDWGYRRLAAAVLVRAVQDAQGDNGRAAPARHWLAGDPWAAFLLDSLELRRQCAAWLADPDPPGQPVLF